MRHWTMIGIGVLLNAIVFLLPLTPYPILQKTFDHEYFDVSRGYEQFLKTGKWKEGDPGFELMRSHYMEDVVRGLRPELDSKDMEGQRLELFQLGEADVAVNIPEKRPVYVIYSNQQGHIIEGNAIKILTATFAKPDAVLVSIGLLMVAVALIYRGLAGLLGSRLNKGVPEGFSASETALLRNTAS